MQISVNAATVFNVTSATIRLCSRDLPERKEKEERKKEKSAVEWRNGLQEKRI